MNKLHKLSERLAQQTLQRELRAQPSKKQRSQGSYAASDQTRQKVIDCAIAAINRFGYAKATTSLIAEQAAVSWGVLQYHFGSKVGLDYAVVMAGMATTEQRLRGLHVAGGTVQERVQVLVKGLFDILCSDMAMAVTEIIVNLRDRGHEDKNHVAILDEMNVVLHTLLHEAIARALPDHTFDAALPQTLTALLRGFNAARAMTARDLAFEEERSLICTMIVRTLQPRQ